MNARADSNAGDTSGAGGDPEPTAARRLRRALPAVALPVVVVVVVPAVLLVTVATGWTLGPGPLTTAGIFAIAGGFLVAIWSVSELVSEGRSSPSPADEPAELVTTGPYTLSRNPMYLAVVVLLVGEALFFGVAALAVYAALVAAGFHLLVTRYEEPALRERFGEDYEAYCEETPRWLLG